MKADKLSQTSTGHMIVEASGFHGNPAERHDWQFAQLQIRRVVRPADSPHGAADETQVEIQLIHTYPSGVSRSMVGGITLDADQAYKVALAVFPELEFME